MDENEVINSDDIELLPVDMGKEDVAPKMEEIKEEMEDEEEKKNFSGEKLN